MVVHDARLLSSAVQLPVSILRLWPGCTVNQSPFIPYAFTTKVSCSALLHLFVGGMVWGPPRPLILYRWVLVTFPPIGEWPSSITRVWNRQEQPWISSSDSFECWGLSVPVTPCR
jgi:hypothetical protein